MLSSEDYQNQFSHWIGRQTVRQDMISDRLIEQFRATFGHHIADQVAVPPGLFWCLSPDALTADRLGGDGHPKLGIYLPEIPYPRRMWAGGSLRFHGTPAEQFAPGQTITKQSTISNIVFKSGRSGDLCFVTVTHHYLADTRLILEEEQNIVYRAEITPVAAASETTSIPDTLASWSVHPDPVMMFRYSALTFNGHRIHYDKPYSMGEEGHPGLVVHGPMQATWLLSLTTSYLGHLPSFMSYRGTAAYIEGMSATVALTSGADTDPDTEKSSDHFCGMVVTEAGIKTMDAQFNA
ncbi:MAG: FAS1-like dehydratase domain-containing protein [Candidatus Puniceispirillales bacterium]